MFASRALEDVQCPDPSCWRGFVCNYKHGAINVSLQEIISTLLSDKSNSNTNIFLSTLYSQSTEANDEVEESSPKRRRFSGDNIIPERSYVQPENTQEVHPTPAFYPHLPTQPAQDVRVPQYSADDLDLLRSSIDDVLKSSGNAPTNYESTQNMPRHDSTTTSARPPPVLRSRIQDVSRQLSALTRASAIPRIGGSLPSSIGDVEKQLNAPAVYRPRKLSTPDVSSPKADVEPSSSDVLKNDEQGATRSIAKAILSSKPIPSIKNKFLINPPIQTNQISVEESKSKQGVKKARKAAPKKATSAIPDDENSEEGSEEDSDESEEDEDAEDDEDEEDDDEGREEEQNNKTNKLVSSPTKPIATSKNIAPNNSNKNNLHAIQLKAPARSQAAKEKLNLANKLNKTKTDTTKNEKAPAVKTPSLFEVGVALTPHQIKATQKLRVDSDKRFAGLSASEYPTILFEIRPKVPRAVRQSYLDKFLVQFLNHFPDNKAQAIEAAVKVENDIYSEAKSKMVYKNLCVNQMKTLFPSV